MAYPRIPTLLAVAVLLLTVATATSSHGQFSVLYNFGTKSGDGTNPSYSGIVAQGRDGNMYSTLRATVEHIIWAQYSRSLLREPLP